MFNLPHSDTNSRQYGTFLTVIYNKIIQEDANVSSDVSVLEVIKVVNKLKLNKHDGIFDLFGNRILRTLFIVHETRWLSNKRGQVKGVRSSVKIQQQGY